jgi:long-chain acyl-CoA synthetase
MVEHMAAGLQVAGLRRGEHMAVIGANRPRLYAAMLARSRWGDSRWRYQDAVGARCVFDQ